jgi:hypothetical protein
MRCGDGAAQRIVHRGGKGRCRRRLARARFEADAEVVENVVGVMKDVDQMRDRRALIAGDVGHVVGRARSPA